MNFSPKTFRKINTAICLFGALSYGTITAAGAASVPESVLARTLNMSHSGESWTDEWSVSDTVVNFPGGGKAGFYRRATKVGDAYPNSEREGILYLLPESRRNPVRIYRDNVLIPEGAPQLLIGVAGNRNPRGDWNLVVQVNGRQIGKDVLVEGGAGWKNLSFDLSSYAKKNVDIVIEAELARRSNPYVFIDFIKINAASSSTLSNMPAQTPENSGFFDRAYQRFLELLNIREDKRSQQIQDQVYQDQQRDLNKK